MGKWRKGYGENRKYNKKWELAYNWLTCKNGMAYCLLCDHSFKVLKKHNLNTHERTAKHTKRAANTTVTVFKAKDGDVPEPATIDANEEIICDADVIEPPPLSLEELVPECEIRFCCSVICHCNMTEIDHVSKIVNFYSKSTELRNLQLNLGKSKCLVIINNVMSCAILEEVMNDLRNSMYSLLINEFTFASSKYVCLCTKYYSLRHESLKTEFLALLPVVSSSGESLFCAVAEFLQSYQIDMKNCIGFCADGGNVCASNSLVSRLKDVSPNISFIKCTSHSLELCCENAMKKLPSNIDYLIAEIARWFKFSTFMINEYNSLFAIMSGGFIKTSVCITPSNTRWLIKGKCINAIVNQWQDLRAYFNVISHEHYNYHAKILNEMLNDVSNYLYLTFILPIVEEFDSVNAAFQAPNADVKKVFKDLDLLHRSMSEKVRSFTLGVKFQKAIEQTDLSEASRNDIKQRCFSFLVEANAELDKRMSAVDYGILNLKMFHPMEFLNVSTTFEEIPKSFLAFAKGNENFPRLEMQYEKVMRVNWIEEFQNETIPADPIKFWSFVKKYENALGERSFETLADTVLCAFAFPLSNAFVERIFCHATNTINKLKSLSSLKTLESVLRIRTYFKSYQICCKDFAVTPRMQTLFAEHLYQLHTISIDGIGVSYSLPPTTDAEHGLAKQEEQDLEDIVSTSF